MRAFLVVGFAVLCACASPSSPDISPTPEFDSELSCVHFRNVAGDAGAGILTGSELREKLKEIYEDSAIAAPAVRAAAQEMLRATTAGEDASEGVAAMGAACTKEGF